MKHNKHFMSIFFGLIFSIILFSSSNAQTFPGTLSLYSQENVEYYATNLPIWGFNSVANLTISDINSGTDITDLTPLYGVINSVTGNLNVQFTPALTKLDGLESITSVGGEILIYSNTLLENLDGLVNITSVGTNVDISGNPKLTDISGLENLTSVSGVLRIGTNAMLTNLAGLENITSTSGSLIISTNAVLTNISALGNITSVGGQLSIDNNNVLANIDGLASLTSIGGKLKIQFNAALTNIDGLASLTSIGGELQIDDNDVLTNLDGLASLTSVGGLNLIIHSNPKLERFCGLFNLLNTGTVYAYDIYDNEENPTLAEIKAAGPCTPSVTTVFVDIKPATCPNSLNVKIKGDIPVAILGTNNFDVQNIDPATLLLEGISPLRWDITDVAAPIISNGEQYDCTIAGPDGFDDLTLKFDAQELVAAFGQFYDGDTLELKLTGSMLDGAPIEGSDYVIIIAKNLKKELAENFSNVPKEYALFENYPNPFNPTTTITYQIPKAGNVELKVYDVFGREVATLVNSYKTVGSYNAKFKASRLASGTYIYRLKSGNFVSTKKMILLK